MMADHPGLGLPTLEHHVLHCHTTAFFAHDMDEQTFSQILCI